ncbi:hypothetical protein [Rhizobium phage RHph_X2_28B]|uniref:hypothetical protein n=1 Tax=Rhizobium phage RHph_X2_28B TaxID=2836086 RepID=UPI00232991C4|nr:hypothetical protein PP751_gp097 [Rhizobium phage RHph_X2_28B]QWY83550.1 hypothetical protein [Rhizobium phage RHph_X2_28B]
MKIYLSEGTPQVHNLIPLKLRNALVLLNKQKKIIREITWDDWQRLNQDFPVEVESDQLSLGSILIAEQVANDNDSPHT